MADRDKTAGRTKRSTALRDIRRAIRSAGLEETVVIIASTPDGVGKRGKKCLVGRVSAGRIRRDSGGKNEQKRGTTAPPDFSEKSVHMLSALGQPMRVGLARIVADLGTASHAELKERSGLQPGPLYHHLRPLIAAGLVSQGKRNQYEVTEAGRVLLALLNGLDQFQREGRRSLGKLRRIVGDSGVRKRRPPVSPPHLEVP